MILTITEVAEATRLSPTSIRRMIARGDFPKPVELGVRKILFRGTDIAEFVMSRSPAADEEPEHWATRLQTLMVSLSASKKQSDGR